MRDWVRVPTRWIDKQRLREFRWIATSGSDAIAALILFAVLAHHADPDTGEAFLTYNRWTLCTGLSRTKVASGLSTLGRAELIERRRSGRSSYRLANYDKERGWGKLPARRLYNAGGEVTFFHELKLRSRTELDALKLYYLFVARRNRRTNMAHISYDKITDYTGLDRSSTRRGISLLAANGMVHIEQIPSGESEHGFANAYRLAHLEGYRHMGTYNRGREAIDFGEAALADDSR